MSLLSRLVPIRFQSTTTSSFSGFAMTKSRNTYHLSDEEKWHIIHVYKNCKAKSEKNKITAVVRGTTFKKRVVMRWIKRYNDCGNVTSKAKSGRRPIFSDSVAAQACHMLKSGQHSSARAVAAHLLSSGLVSTLPSHNTVIKHARRQSKLSGNELRLRRGYPKKGLTVDTKRKRIMFAVENLGTMWERVMFTDRKRFFHRFPGSSVSLLEWYEDDGSGTASAAVEGVYQPNKPSCFNIYAAITTIGATQIYEVAGSTSYRHRHVNKQGKPAKNITGDQYKVIVRGFLDEGERIFGEGSLWYLQQDNDPAHRVAHAVVQEYNEKNGSQVQLLPNWPPNSPDLNVIENFWSWVQNRVYKRGCSTLSEFKQAVKEEVTSTPPSTLKCLASLYKSLPKRMATVLQRDGKKTGY